MRIAFKMQVHPGHEEEYERRHRPIWPELEQALREHGVRSYSIFLNGETNLLFAYAEVDSLERWESIAETEVCKRWWKSMQPLMPTNPDASPRSASLREVFHLSC